jgi:hypothetical protein
VRVVRGVLGALSIHGAVEPGDPRGVVDGAVDLDLLIVEHGGEDVEDTLYEQLALLVVRKVEGT